VSLQRTLDVDAQATTHAIRTRVDTPDEIGELFDGISYGKAAALLAMVERYVGAETFRQGIHKYLAAHRFANATAEDFSGALTTVSHKPAGRIMSSFVEQPGVPLLNVGRAGNGALAVSQERFFLDSTSRSDRSMQWTLPICLTGVSASCRLLDSAKQSLRLVPTGVPFANAGGLGYYRTSYSQAIRREIIAQVESSLTPPERIALLGDQWALVRSGAATVGEILDLAAAMHADPDDTVLEQLLAVLGEVDTRLATDATRVRLRAWIRTQFSPMYSALGPAPSGGAVESPDRARRRSLLLVTLGDADDPGVVAEARVLADRYIANQASVEPSLAQSASYVASRHGDATLYDKLIALHASSPDPAVRATALFLTTHFRDTVLIATTLDAIASGTIPNRDGATMLAILVRNRDTQDQAWRYVVQHWGNIHESATGRFVNATGSFCSVEKRDEVLAFFATHRIASADRGVTIAGQAIMSCVAFRAAAQPSLTAWLSAHE
jgi:aminopeptidase N/puromycin-sensitive aminopeptidase